jgi:hypothetical protein
LRCALLIFASPFIAVAFQRRYRHVGQDRDRFGPQGSGQHGTRRGGVIG